jgi:hypothetical protein
MKLPPRLWKLLHSRSFKRLLIASPFLALISLLLFYAIVNTWGTHKLNQTRANLQQRGYALTFEELIHPPPTSGIDLKDAFDTSSITYQEVNILIDSLSDWEKSHGDPETGEPPNIARITHISAPPSDNPASTAHLYLNSLTQPPSLTDDLADALQKATHVTDKITEYMSGTLLGSTTDITKYVRLLPFFHEQARLHATAGDADAAIRSLETPLRFIDLKATRAPTIFSDLQIIKIQASHTLAIWDLASLPATKDEHLTLFASQLESFSNTPLFNDAFAATMVQASEFQYHFGDFTVISPEHYKWTFDWRNPNNWLSSLGANFWQIKPAGFVRSEIADTLQLIDKEFLHHPDGSPRKNWHHEETKTLQQKADAATPIKTTVGLDYSIDDMFLTQYANLIPPLLTHQTEIRLATIAIAIERHRRATGILPQSHTDLTPTYLQSIPENLLSDHPFHIRPAPSSPHQMQIIAPGPTPDTDLIWHSPHPN